MWTAKFDYVGLSPEFTKRTGAYHSPPPPHSAFSKFVFKMTIEIILSSCQINEIDICSRRKLSELQFADDIVLLTEDPV